MTLPASEKPDAEMMAVAERVAAFIATGGGSTVAVSGGTLTGGSGAVNVNGATTVSASGIINAGTSTAFKLNAAFSLGNGTTAGTFNANSAAVTVVTPAVFSLLSGSTFNGGTGTTDIQAAPTLTSGTFNVGTSAANVTFENNTTFSGPVATGTTLAFSASGGELRVSQGKTLTMAGTITASTTGTKPKIDCLGCAANQGVGIVFATGAKLNINGLEFDNASTAGVTIQTSVTYTLLKNLKFLNNAGNSTSGTHLFITLDTAVINVPGCYFDTTATKNVTLYGTMGSNSAARAIFENQNSTTNGSGAGETRDADGDDGVSPDAKADDGYGNDTNSPWYGSVVEWVNASPTDTTGTAVAFPTAAFDWNTFAYYGVYVSYKNASAGDSVLWHRNEDGSPAYSFTVDHTTSGDLIGTPYWDTVSENNNVDLNGNGSKTDKVHIVYLATTGGHIIKLVDTGAALTRPSNGAWTSDFTDATVTSITSPLANDLTNLYFGGTNGTTPNVYAVQIMSGTTETKTLVKTKGPLVSTLTTTPSWTTSSGTTYVFLGTTTPSSGNALIYRLNMSGTVDGSYDTLATSAINGAIVIQGGHAFAVSDAGKLFALDALNFGTGGFTNISSFPFQNSPASPIKFSAWVGPDGVSFFGDNAGNVYDVKADGTKGWTNPVSIGSAQITSTPIYRQDSGVIGIGANDGYLYFIDRSAASVFKRFFITASGSVSSVSYDKNIPAFMVSSSDGKLVFINAADVTDPTSGSI